MTAPFIETSHPVTKPNRCDILYLAQARLGDDVPELESVTTSPQAIEALLARLEAEPKSSRLYLRLKQFLDSHNK